MCGQIYIFELSQLHSHPIVSPSQLTSVLINSFLWFNYSAHYCSLSFLLKRTNYFLLLNFSFTEQKADTSMSLPSPAHIIPAPARSNPRDGVSHAHREKLCAEESGAFLRQSWPQSRPEREERAGPSVWCLRKVLWPQESVQAKVTCHLSLSVCFGLLPEKSSKPDTGVPGTSSVDLSGFLRTQTSYFFALHFSKCPFQPTLNWPSCHSAKWGVFCVAARRGKLPCQRIEIGRITWSKRP